VSDHTKKTLQQKAKRLSEDTLEMSPEEMSAIAINVSNKRMENKNAKQSLSFAENNEYF